MHLPNLLCFFHVAILSTWITMSVVLAQSKDFPEARAISQAPIICIDPGHPSENGWGTRGKKVTEVEITWKIALRVKALLERDGFRVILTKRYKDQFVTNRERAEIASKARAALMVRLHCDATKGSGVGTFYPDRQGRVGMVSGPSPQVIFASQVMAKRFHEGLLKELNGALPNRGLRSDRYTNIGARQGALTGSIFSKVPVFLVELCVLTNPKDECFIASDNGQQKMARAIAFGIKAALSSKLGHRMEEKMK